MSGAAPRPTPRPAIRGLDDLLERRALAPIVDDYRRVEDMIVGNIHFGLDIVPRVVRYLLEAGGKRIRPIVHCLAAHMVDYAGEDHLLVASVGEMVHSATLFHDDVIDEGMTRRGIPTANRVWGNQTPVLVGDFLFARAFSIMMNHRHYEIARRLAPTVEDLVRGELIQLAHRGKPVVPLEAYREIIRCKTASLFSWCALSAGLLAGLPEERVEDLSRFGHHFGLAFQISDDVLDYSGDGDSTGKGTFSDLAEGKTTLPLILAVRRDPEIGRELKEWLRGDGAPRPAPDFLASRVLESGAIEESIQIAGEHAERAEAALLPFPEGPFREALFDLCRFTVSRTH
ncbi:MAG: polyprenyl synthetase family protein [Candidatus Eisenbacteria bacterium]|nr:polyprenyl synthetase family protein [Candidatus Eisenbacteria bacterium]